MIWILLPDEVVWICFLCAQSFPNQSELMTHQDKCEDPESPSVSPDNPAELTGLGVIEQAGSHVHELTGSMVAVRTGCSDTSVTDMPVIVKKEPVNQPVPQPVPTLLRKVGSSLNSLPLGLPRKQRKRRKFEDIYIPPCRDVYFESLGLAQTPKVEEIIRSPRKSVSDEDCQIIDLTVDEEQPQSMPVTPRSRSLISQLSRDDTSARKRQLSFSQPHSSPLKTLSSKKASGESSDSSDEEVRRPVAKVPAKTWILGIPLTSPLGQRLKKHWSFDCKVPIIKDIEQVCKTDNIFSEYDPYRRKNPMVEKLRNRPPPQVTFRFTKRYINKWFHLFKFNKADKKEFEKRLRTGLDRESRLRLKLMRPCQVVLERVSKKDIKFWTSPRPRLVQARSVLSQCINQKAVPGYQARPIRPRSHFQIQNQYTRQAFTQAFPHQNLRPTPNIISQAKNLQYIQNLQAIPTPQLLVRSMPNGGGMQIQVMEMANTSRHIPGQNFFASPPSHSQKRKQSFQNIRHDDMIICLSSDEEDNGNKNQSNSHTNKPELLRLLSDSSKKKIGPASFMRIQERKERLSTSARSVSFSEPLTDITPPDTLVAGAVSLKDSTQSENTFTHMRISNGCVENLDVKQEQAEQGDQAKPTDDSDTGDKGKSPSPTDYMDFEVICIDSDEED